MDAILSFDQQVISGLNAFVGRVPAFDHFMILLANAPLAKVGLFGAFLWWAWFRRDGGVEGRRIFVIRAVCGALLAALVSRLSQNLMPHRPRPVHDPALGFVVPDGLNAASLHEWSSFPSDNAALVFALAAAVWIVSRRLGVAAFLWAALVVCFPRLYLGLHYLTDLAAGGLIGIVCTAAAVSLPGSAGLSRRLLAAEVRHAPLFYGLAFLLVFQLVTLFDDARRLAGGLMRLVKGLTMMV